MILTIDIGTTGVKCALVSEDCAAAASAEETYPTHYPHPGWAEQQPDDYLSAASRAAARLRALYPNLMDAVGVIGLCGTMNGCIAVDAGGKPLHPQILHSDTRAEAQLNEIAAVCPPDAFYRLTGNRLDAHFTLPKLLWLRSHRRDVYDRARFILNTKDYMYGLLTGRWGVTDPSDASLFCALDIGRRAWAAELLRDLSVDAALLPDIRPSRDVSGTLTAQAAQLLGLRAGLPVAVGGGDGACAARGAGLSAAGDGYAYIGSSAWISVMCDAPVFDDKARVFNYLDMDGVHVYPTGTVQCAAAAYNWAVQHIMGLEPSPAAFEQAEALALTSEPGARGVLFAPYLMGERTPHWDARTRGLYVGFTLYNDRSDMMRATYEGIAFALCDCLNALRDNGCAPEALAMTGGGARSGLWPALLATAAELPVRVHARPGEATALGCAMAAGVGVGLFSSYEDAARRIQFAAERLPDGAQREQLRRAYRIYRRLYEQLKPIYDMLGEG